MEQAVQIFNNPEFGDVRVIGDAENPRFCLSDVCKVLELQAAAVMRRLDKGVTSNHTLQTAGGMQTLTFVNEDGLYDVILDSRKPKAKEFRKWVTSEVLPSIRKHGMYMTVETAEKILYNPDFIIGLAQQVKDANAKIAELQPKADYCEKVLESTEHLTSELIAKEYGESAHWLHETLINYNVMYMRRRGKRCYYYMKAPYDKGGYRDSETVTLERGRTVVTHYWTQKGRHFVYNFLKKCGIVPLTEHNDAIVPLFKEATT